MKITKLEELALSLEWEKLTIELDSMFDKKLTEENTTEIESVFQYIGIVGLSQILRLAESKVLRKFCKTLIIALK